MNTATIERMELSTVCTGKYRYTDKKNKHSSAKNTGKKHRKEKRFEKEILQKQQEQREKKQRKQFKQTFEKERDEKVIPDEPMKCSHSLTK